MKNKLINLGIAGAAVGKTNDVYAEYYSSVSVWRFLGIITLLALGVGLTVYVLSLFINEKQRTRQENT